MRNTTPQAQNCKPIESDDAEMIGRIAERIDRLSEKIVGAATNNPTTILPALQRAGFDEAWIENDVLLALLCAAQTIPDRDVDAIRRCALGVIGRGELAEHPYDTIDAALAWPGITSLAEGAAGQLRAIIQNRSNGIYLIRRGWKILQSLADNREGVECLR